MANTSCGKNLKWRLNNGILTISGTGDMYDNYWYSEAPWYYNESKFIKKVIIEAGVTSIGKSSFNKCESLKEITIPSSVTRIGDNAFFWCTSLMNVIIPGKVTEIGENAFYKCTSLREVKILGNVMEIGEYAFYDCNNLREITLPDGLIKIGGIAFGSCSSLEAVNFPDSLVEIGNVAFSDCHSLKEITLPTSLKKVGRYAFEKCISLREVKLLGNLGEIGEKVFYGCSALTKIYFLAGSNSMSRLREGNSARLIPYTPPPVIKPKLQPQPIFKPPTPTPRPVIKSTVPPAQVKPTPKPVSKPTSQPAVESLRWKVEGKTLTVGGVSEIKSYSYSETPWRDSLRDIQKIIIEEGVKKISANAFAECKRLEQLTIPASVKTIGDGAFTFCYCGDRTINSGRNIFWSLDDGTLMIKKNPAAKKESNFSTGYETWQVIEGNINAVKIERGIVPGKRFFDWLSRMGDGVAVSF